MNTKNILQTLELAETELKSCYRKLGIIDSNVLKDVIEAQDQVKNCSIPDVRQQRELLKAFCKWAFKENSDWHQVNSHINEYLNSL